MSVRKGPGQRQLTVTPCGPSSMAPVCVMPARAALVAVYEVRPSLLPSAPIDEMCTIRPQPRATIAGASALTSATPALKFVCTVVCQPSSLSGFSCVVSAVPWMASGRDTCHQHRWDVLGFRYAPVT